MCFGHKSKPKPLSWLEKEAQKKADHDERFRETVRLSREYEANKLAEQEATRLATGPNLQKRLSQTKLKEEEARIGERERPVTPAVVNDHRKAFVPKAVVMRDTAGKDGYHSGDVKPAMKRASEKSSLKSSRNVAVDDGGQSSGRVNGGGGAMGYGGTYGYDPCSCNGSGGVGDFGGSSGGGGGDSGGGGGDGGGGGGCD